MVSNKSRTGAAVVAGALLAGLVGTAAAGSAQAAPAREPLRQAVGELVTTGIAGVQLRVHDRRGGWTGNAGVRELGESAEPSTTGRFRAGSTTKAFTATVVLQLVGEGRVELDEPVARHLPRYGLDRRITVRMLLQHTTGLFNYTGSPRADGTIEAGIPLFGKQWAGDRFRTYRSDELVRFALTKPALFPPGEEFSYSNTNYLLAGLLIEKVTGTSYASQVERRILKPLGLRDTSLPGTRTEIPGRTAHGYHSYQDGGRLTTVDVTRQNPSWAGPAGEIISTTADLDRFLGALLGGRLLPPRLLAEMRTTRTTSGNDGYGLGLEVHEFAPGCFGVGHTGGVQGFTTYMYSTLDGAKRVAMSENHGRYDFVDPTANQKIRDAEYKVVAAALCG
ncbi:serine hydrolase domain-containing protein [Actinosynnema sp. NPDC047251]|uniref:serine hydrolase domain-containing protein n=1 Tax=Saccharothrix espanaensis TaxID=103731 RepID=UPI0002DC6817|nr:serine hydrolase domain-containing protein [Saccharothrix espanaensis]